MASAGDHHHRHREHDTHQAGHDVVLGEVLRVVLGVDGEIHRAIRAAQAGERPRQVAVEHRGGERARGGDRRAGGRRVGGVGLNQHGRALAAEQLA
jgi:hypothetical protein